ncbi:Fc.00g060270.m01.CDS01 [Cosmosporella sp. VM-42]
MPSAVSEFHPGERAMHNLLKVPRLENPTAPGLPVQYGMRVMQSSLLALGTLDEEGRPWTTVWGGERGFARAVAQGVLGINSVVDTEFDPVFKSLWGGSGGEDGEIVRPNDGQGKAMAALSIDLQTRDRVKLGGKMIAGAVVGASESRIQMAMAVTESLGNCPKYLNKKDIVPHVPTPQLVSESLPLPKEAVELIAKADMFFLSSTDGETMDTNHRGGPPGFVRVVRNDDGGLDVVYPEYSGNRLYQTLGNFKVNPLVGVAIPDFTNSDVLHLTGTASILVGAEASSLIAKTNLAVKISVTDTKFIKSGLPFRGDVIDYSPYNPPIRHLVSEQHAVQSISANRLDINASLVKREVLTPSINRFTLKLESSGLIPKWKAGQYITLDFEPELGAGYSHMRDDDPQSLNDDLIRTFTISSPPGKTDEIQITARRHGPVTAFLWKHNLRVPLEIPVLGFGGEESFQVSTNPAVSEPVFIAAGVGITPLLAQAPALLSAGGKLRLLWSLRAEDLPFAEDVFTRIPGLADVTTLFVTGGGVEDVHAGVKVEKRRMREGDVESFKTKLDDGDVKIKRKFFLCTAPGMLRSLMGWLEGEDVVWEEFAF